MSHAATVLLVTLCLVMAGCATPHGFDRRAATLDACCISPIPQDAANQKFLTGRVRMQSITLCVTR